VLSDGLGTGVKANILARLTAEIIVTMVREAAPVEEVIETVIGTLPICKVRKIAYATFIFVEVHNQSGRFKVINFDSPPALWLKQGRLQPLEQRTEIIHGKQLAFAEGVLDQGDFLALMSDGVLFAGMGLTLSFGWGWEKIGAHLEDLARSRHQTAYTLARGAMQKAESLYEGKVADDATFVGVLARRANRLMVFTGPPFNRTQDDGCVERLLGFDGRKVVCGGTTGNIVAQYLGREIETDFSTLRDDLPPIGYLPEIDLITEGILTLAGTLQLLKQSKGQAQELPTDRNAAVLLSRELLEADSVLFLAGETINPHYQNPLLPKSVSIRRNVIDQIAQVLAGFQKEVKVEWT
jgi:hypothetical protein